MYASGGFSSITVFGNVVASSGGTGTVIGARADSNCSVTVEGSITSSGIYIRVGTTDKTQTPYPVSTFKPGYYEYSTGGIGAATIWVSSADYNVSNSTELTSALNAIAALPAGSSATIKLLQSFTYNSGIVVNNKIITFDLNGMTLNVVSPGEYGLEVKNSGQVKLLDPTNGWLNVTGLWCGVHATAGSMVEVTNAKAIGESGFSGFSGVYAGSAGSEVIVYGNVSLDVGGSSNRGVWVRDGGKVTVNGKIDIKTDSVYIRITDGTIFTNKTQTDGVFDAVMIGYLKYTDGTSTVWVQIPTAPGITGDMTMSLTVGYAATSTTAYTITGSSVPTVMKTSSDAKITWNNATKKLDIAAGLGEGVYPVVLTASNGITPNATITFTLTVTPPPTVGDINKDGKVDAEDVKILKEYLHGFTPHTPDLNWNAADLDGDGVLNVFDLAALKRIVVVK